MKSFKHYNPGSIDELFSLLNSFGSKANLMAGGTDLLGVLKTEILPDYPDAVINIKTIPGLDYIEEDDDGLKIGALTKLCDIVSDPIIKEKYIALAEAAKSVAFPEIRNMATIGGNLCQDSRCWYYRYPHSMGGRIQCYRKGKGPCLAIKGDNRYHAILEGKKCFAVCPSDIAIVLRAMDANIRAVSPAGERIIPIADFYNTLGHILKKDEVLTGIKIPRPHKDAVQRFLKFRLRDSIDFAVVSVASIVVLSNTICSDSRIVLGAVAPTPYRAIEAEKVVKGSRLDKSTAEAAAEAAMDRAKPMNMNAYKVEIAKTLIKRALLN